MALQPLARLAQGTFLPLITRRPVAVGMFMVAIAVLGVVSFTKLRTDLLPEISYPTLTVRTTYTGAAPEDVEDRVSERIQEALSTLPHIVRTTSLSRAETSDVVLDFEWGTSMTFAVQDVRDRLDSVVLPRDAERPLILRYDPNLDPILRIGITLPEGKKFAGDKERELIQLRWLAEKRIKRDLETIPGIAAVQVRGGLQEEIRIRVDPFKMAAQDLDPALLSARLAQENLNASGGLIREGSSEYLVRTLNEFRNVEEIENLAIVRRGNAVIRVKDIGSVSRTHAEREVVTRIGDHEAVEIAVFREAGANIVQLVDAVRERVFGTQAQQAWARQQAAQKGAQGTFGERAMADDLAWQLRDEAHFDVLSDQSNFIRDSIHDLRDSALVGGALTMFVIWLALRRFVPTLIISVSLPMSVIVTFAPMYMLGVTLNIMSLGGLALGVGMVVDASIVVLESIMRCRDEGDSLVDAAIRGTREVAGAVSGSTLTSIAVFAPIVFVHGIAGRIFGDQSMTVVSSHVISLLVALVLIPVLASRRFLAAAEELLAAERPARVLAGLDWGWARAVPDALTAGGRSLLRLLGWFVRGAAFLVFLVSRACSFLFHPLLRLHDWGWGHVERSYPRFLGGALAHPWKVVLASVLLLAGAAWRAPKLGLNLLPEVHQGEFTAFVGLPVGTPLATTESVLSALELRVRALAGVERTALTVGIEKDTLTREIEGKHTARLTVRLQRALANPRDEERIVDAVRTIIGSDAHVRSIDIKRSNPFALEAPIEVEVLGYDLEKIHAVAREVEQRMLHVPGLADVRTTIRPGHPEARITFDRDKMLEYGLDINAVSTYVRDQVLGSVSTRFNQGDERIDIRVQGDEILLGSLERVLTLDVSPASTRSVPLSAVARVDVIEGPAEIRRIGNTRAIIVSAITGGGLDLGGTSGAIERQLASLQLPGDVVVQMGGQKREMEEGQQSMTFALLLALFLVYVVMATQFESLLQPLIILVTVPLAFVGVIFALDALAIPVSVVVFIGLILLAGIVVANAIVLISRINQTRAGGLALREAILEAGATRLRPIYMTANTTVIGLLPMTGWLVWIPVIGALGSGAGAELRAPMAVTVVVGLTCSTLLTLVVIPTVYWLLYRGRRTEVAPA
jgi:HAE1 family hydrophobic/amphiphilic exporter-1